MSQCEPSIGIMSAAGVRKGWKTAACLMLATGAFKYTRPPLPKAAIWSPGKFGATPPVCLESVGGCGNGSKPEQDMEMLFVCRSRKSSFMANTYVFPGGVIESADYSPQWKDLYHECCVPYKNPFSPILDLNQPNRPKLPLYNDIKNTPIAGEVAYRICAIREVFEEAGVLLVRDKQQVAQMVDILPGSFPPAMKTLPAGVLSEWRRRVHDNADEFLTMCKELQCVPDIWSLIEWSDWLTPRNLHRRYDTVFYLCFCEEQPPSCPDDKEVVDSKWLSTGGAIQQFISGELTLAPPQFAELNILQSFGSAPCLHSYALLESVQGSHSRLTVVRIMTKDNIILSLMADDDLYPLEGGETTDAEGAIHHPQSPILRDKIQLRVSNQMSYEYECPSHTADELRTLCDTKNRMELHGMKDYRFVDDVHSRKIVEHVERFFLATKSKL